MGRSIQEILTITQDINRCRHSYECLAGNTKLFRNLRCCWGNHRCRDRADKIERRHNNGDRPFLAVRPARICQVQVVANWTKRSHTTHFFGFIGSPGSSQFTHNTLASDVSELTFSVLVCGTFSVVSSDKRSP